MDEPCERRPSGIVRHTLLRGPVTVGGSEYDEVEYDVYVDLESETAEVRTATGWGALGLSTDLASLCGTALALTATEVSDIHEAAADREDAAREDAAESRWER